MPTLVWDKLDERTYEMGVSKGVCYTDTVGENGAVEQYAQAEVWNGLTAVTDSPEGAEPTKIYGSNIEYAMFRSLEQYKATIEAFMYPDNFSECNGYKSLIAGGGLYAGQQKRKRFGFTWRTEVGNGTVEAGDGTLYKIHIVYGATTSPSETAHNTINESPDVEPMSWEMDTIPVAIEGGKPASKLIIESWKFTKTQMDALEAVLYGGTGENANARLPLPAEVATLLKTA